MCIRDSYRTCQKCDPFCPETEGTAVSLRWSQRYSAEDMDTLADSETGREIFPALTGAWEEKAVFEAGQGSAAGSAAVSRAELARAMNSLLSRSPDREDAQLRAAA